MTRNIKIGCRITPEQHNKLHRIKEEYGFKSTYEILQVLLGVFIDKTEDRHNPNDGTSTRYISNMLDSYTDQHDVPKRYAMHHNIEEEVNEMFDDYSNHQTPEYGAGARQTRRNSI